MHRCHVIHNNVSQMHDLHRKTTYTMCIRIVQLYIVPGVRLIKLTSSGGQGLLRRAFWQSVSEHNAYHMRCIFCGTAHTVLGVNMGVIPANRVRYLVSMLVVLQLPHFGSHVLLVVGILHDTSPHGLPRGMVCMLIE
jgi:hypothetical protein